MLANNSNGQDDMPESASALKTKLSLELCHLGWLAMFASILLWKNEIEFSSSLGNTENHYRIVLVLLSAAIALASLLRTGTNLAVDSRLPIALLLIYGFVCVVSSALLPSQGMYIVWKGSEVLVDVALAACLAGRPFQNALARTRMAYLCLIFALTALLIVFCTEALLWPSSATIPSRGVIPFTITGMLPVYNGNSLAFLCAVLSLFALARAVGARSALARVSAVAFLAWTLSVLIMAQSRTSAIGFLVAAIVFLWLAQRRRLALLTMALIAGVMLAQQLSLNLEEYLVRGQSHELLYSLSGRTQGWEAAWQLFLDSPFVGSGFAAAARVYILGAGGASTLHGAVFDVLVGVGLVGFIPWAFAVVWTGVTLWRQRSVLMKIRQIGFNATWHAEMCSLFVLIIVRSTTSSGLGYHDHTFMLFLVVATYAVSMQRAISAVRRGKVVEQKKVH